MERRRKAYWALAVIHAIFWLLIISVSIALDGFFADRGFITLVSLFAIIPIGTLAFSSETLLGKYFDESLKGYIGFWFVAFGYLALLSISPGSVSVFLDTRYWGDQLLAFYGVALFPFATFLLEAMTKPKP